MSTDTIDDGALHVSYIFTDFVPAGCVHFLQRGVGIMQPGFRPHHNHFIALSLSFPICKMGVKIVSAASGYSEYYMS